MKIGVYGIINNPLPELYLNKEINVKQSEFDYYDGIVEALNREVKMDKLHSEYMYALAMTCTNIPKGLLLISVGDHESCMFNKREMATGLLLLGAERFMVFHNHPGYAIDVSEADIDITREMIEIADLLNIEFVDHLMITKNHYESCKPKTHTIDVFGVEVEVEDGGVLDEW